MDDEERAAWELRLYQWDQRRRASESVRDELIRGAVKAGVTKHRVHVITGLARTTIDRIVEGTHTG